MDSWGRSCPRLCLRLDPVTRGITFPDVIACTRDMTVLFMESGRVPVGLMATNSARQALQHRVATAVLEGAARTLAVQGSAASMTEVAAAAGVARATVYRYFPNRQALLDELALVALREADDRIRSARIDEVPAAEAISRVVRALVDIGDAFIVVARERARPAEFDRTLVDPLTRLFERSQAGGDIRDDLPATWLTEALLGLTVSVLTSLPSQGREDTVAAIASLFLDGARRRRPHLQ
jgi:TetR/AcrR family transcriptional repressor of mexCD-oprJ operon